MRQSQRALRNLGVLVAAEAIALICVGIAKAANAVDPNISLTIFEVASCVAAAELVCATPLLCYEAYKRCRVPGSAEPIPADNVHIPPVILELRNVPSYSPLSPSKLVPSPPTDYNAVKKISGGMY
jgi:hypothetical protein